MSLYSSEVANKGAEGGNIGVFEWCERNEGYTWDMKTSTIAAQHESVGMLLVVCSYLADMFIEEVFCTLARNGIPIRGDIFTTAAKVGSRNFMDLLCTTCQHFPDGTMYCDAAASGRKDLFQYWLVAGRWEPYKVLPFIAIVIYSDYLRMNNLWR